MADSAVQYRPVDQTLSADNLTAPKGDVAGRTVVTGDAAAPVPMSVVPASLTAFGRTVYRTAGPSFYENSSTVAAVSRVVELLYVQVGKALTNAITLYVLVVDKAGAVVAGDGSAVPLPKIVSAGEMIVWEPPDGFLFANGIRVIVSTDPNIYAAPAAPEPISVACRTRNP